MSLINLKMEELPLRGFRSPEAISIHLNSIKKTSNEVRIPVLAGQAANSHESYKLGEVGIPALNSYFI